MLYHQKKGSPTSNFLNHKSNSIISRSRAAFVEKNVLIINFEMSSNIWKLHFDIQIWFTDSVKKKRSQLFRISYKNFLVVKQTQREIFWPTLTAILVNSPCFSLV